MIGPDWTTDITRFRRTRGAQLEGGTVRCDRSGCAYVAYAGDQAILKIGARGRLLLRISPEDDTHGLKQPRSVAVDRAGRIFVADYGGNSGQRVITFDSKGRWLTSFVPAEPPEAIVIDRRGFLYVHAPRHARRILKYNSEGRWVGEFGKRPLRYARVSSGSRVAYGGPEDLSRLAIDRHDWIYFAPRWTYDIAVLASTGHVVDRIRRPVQERPFLDVLDGRLQRVGYDAIVLDIAIPVAGDIVYVLRPPNGAGGSRIDVWNGRRLKHQIKLDESWTSIASDNEGGLYLLRTDPSKDILEVAKYSAKRLDQMRL
jgi:hypothetical protein